MFMKTIYLLSLLLSLNAFAKEAATVLILRGEVKAKGADGKVFDVKKDDKIDEKTVLTTGDKSFVKLIFIDKSQMNLGPNSQMEVTEFPKNEAGIINLVKGELRSKVTKDYMDMDKKDQSKLFIKTKTAAMGVRGTEFKVIFNPENNITSLVTFEGRVAMAAIDERSPADISINQRALEQAVSSPDAQMVTQGQYSGVNPSVGQGQPSEPVKINPQQLENLKANETGAQEKAPENVNNDTAKVFNNPIPPGVDAKTFSNTSPNLETGLVGLAPKDEASQLELKSVTQSPVNTQMAGGYIDTKTAFYIPPPPGSAYDSNTGMYTPPPSYGSINATGEYVPPAGLELKSNGEFVNVKTETNPDGRAPASQKDDEKDSNSKDDKDAPKDGKGQTGSKGPMNINSLQIKMISLNSGSSFSPNDQKPINNAQAISTEDLLRTLFRNHDQNTQRIIQETQTRVKFNATSN
jgi:hypothetical protein